MKNTSMAGIRIPQVAVASAPLDLENGSPDLPLGTTLLMLAEVDGEVLCCTGAGLMFKVPIEGIAARLRPIEVPERPDEGVGGAAGLLLSLLTVGCAALAAVEAEGEGTIRSFGDALWYGINTVSTVGVGDVTPATPMGKLISSALMVLGNPLYARAGDSIFGRFLGPTGRDQCDGLAEMLRASMA